VASKIYYHLAVYDDALQFALLSGPLFDVAESSDYVGCVVGKCLDRYTRLKLAGEAPGAPLEKLYNAVLPQAPPGCAPPRNIVAGGFLSRRCEPSCHR